MNGTVASELAGIFPAARISEFHRGSAGLYHLFRALAVVRGPGEVVVPNLCCETVALAVCCAGHTVRFADVDGERFCLAPKSLLAAIGPFTRAVVVVHLFGLTVDAGTFREVRAENPDVVFVEDVAHAAGGCDATGREVGSSFDHTMFSFSDSKIFGGEGGAIVSHRDDEVARRLHESATEKLAAPADPLLALSLRNLVHSIADLHRAGSVGAGSDLRPSMWERYRPLVAGGGSFEGSERAVADLRDREAIRKRRHGRAKRYRETILHSGFRLPEMHPGETCWRFPLLAEAPELRRRATEALRREGLHASNHYFPLNRLFGGDALPASEFVGDRILNLWVDDSTSEPRIAATARVLNSL